MNSIEETIELYRNNEIDKSTFIESMYLKHHKNLYEYSAYLHKTDIEKITIENGRVTTTSRKHGIRIECDRGDYRIAPIESLNFYDYEKDESDVLENLIRFEGGKKVFFDIGANIGWYSIMAAKLSRNISVHSFEPIPTTYASLARNVELNALPNISTHNFGFSDKEGVFDFYYYPEGSGNASSTNVSGRSDVEVLQCKVKTIDKYIKNDAKVDFIKCDVEGAELFVFQGGINTIKKNKPIIFSEILRKWSDKFNYDPNDIFKMFESLGYMSFTAENNTLYPFKRMDKATTATNFFFLHAKKHKNLIIKFSAG